MIFSSTVAPLALKIWEFFANHWLSLVVVFLINYQVALSVYRLYLSPLRQIPGSRVTIATGWYETYLEVFKGDLGGQLTFAIERWHHQYGALLFDNVGDDRMLI